MAVNTTWDEWVIADLDDMKQRLSHLNVAIRFDSNSNKSVELEKKISDKLILAKRILRDDILLTFKKNYPQTVKNWLNFKRNSVDYQAQALSRDLDQIGKVSGIVGNVLGPFVNLATTMDLLFLLYVNNSMHPSTYNNFGVPTSGSNGSLAGIAMVGDVLLDSLNYILYINTSLDINYPNWVRMMTTSIIDNILNAGKDANGNPGQLTEPHVLKTIALMFEDGMAGSDRANYDSIPYWQNLRKHYENEYEKSFKIHYTQLQLNISQSGVLQDFELSLNETQPWVMA